MQEGQRHTLVVQNAGSGGEGVCLLDGIPVFVPGALPGETVTIELTARTPRYAKARLVSVLSPSGHRVTPACPHYSACGGCDMLHMSDELSNSIRQTSLENTLWHIGRIPKGSYEIHPILPCPPGADTRNKALYHVQRSVRVNIGFHQKGSHQVIDLTSCAMQSQGSNTALRVVRSWLEETPDAELVSLMTRTLRTGGLFLVLVSPMKALPHTKALIAALKSSDIPIVGVVHCLPSRHSDAPGSTVQVLYGEPHAYDTILGHRFRIAPQTFFQVNAHQSDALYQAAMTLAAPQGKQVLDAYCGAGTLSICMAKAGAHKVTGIEIVPEAVIDAQHNAVINDAQECTFQLGSVEKALPGLMAGTKFDVAIVDPPRKGCDAQTLRTIAQAQIGRVVYLSCNPATLARDAQLLSSLGYRLTTIQPVDMFPHTSHVEVVAKFSVTI